ncbi:LacI family DNA-binding transcriptional regulator [Mammaliicoccus sciuri]|uniref:Transcriptional regulator, LacI family n=1 Tax=Sporosarcina newyorkensis TaxID=759851 RepID=A0A1T4XYR4_9BACL|nr:LacI family DNA-binding transcriptional regulator [Sporosarcina newyorkensis]SKA94690.1 transcriptional regulator, LacI family [Sporosarcina newyorkensis]
MRTESKPTIQDVAKHASVSIATVSRVINNQGGVRAETEKRIVHAIKELGYVRNAVARSMKKKETKMIGIIIPDINNPFFPLVVSGIEQQARKKGYYTMLSNTSESPIVESEIINILVERGVDGVVITTADEYGKQFQILQEQGIPVVALDRRINEYNFDSVLIDNIDGAYQATKQLILQGHQDIAIICGPHSTTPGRDRFAGYLKALSDYEIPLNDQFVVQGSFSEEGGYSATRTLNELEVRPTAIFSSNNLMSIGCIKALQDLEWRLGEEVAFIGFDDIEIATFTKPKLSVVSRPMNALGELAFQLLHERILANEVFSPRNYLLSPELKIRESCRLGNIRLNHKRS